MRPLSSSQQQTLEVVERRIRDLFSSDASGHDYDHIKRVVNLTTRLLVEEANPFITYMIAYMHDVFDDKLNLGFETLDQCVKAWDLNLEGYDEAIETGILSIGYKNGRKVERSLEAAIVSDADFLDAMGAVGIGRAFYYAGYKGLPFHKQELEGLIAHTYEEYRTLSRNAIAHFEEKLLKLIDYIETDKAKELAVERHKVLQVFYDDFINEVQ